MKKLAMVVILVVSLAFLGCAGMSDLKIQAGTLLLHGLTLQPAPHR